MNLASPLTHDYGHADLAVAEANAPHPLVALRRVMRGRWMLAAGTALVLGSVLGLGGFLTGRQVYESQAILRLYPQEANILYRTADDSVLKTFDSFVKAETTYVASGPVMGRAVDLLRPRFAEKTAEMTATDLSQAVAVKRVDSLIVLTMRSQDPAFAAGSLQAVLSAYMALKSEGESQRSAVRLAELQGREATLVQRQAEIRQEILAVGGEFGVDALTKAHVEKVAQIEAIAARKAEVEATLASLRAKSGTSSADMSDDEIMRATLLDRALADLNFDRAKREAELATLLTRYSDESRAVQDKRGEIAVIDQAMAERREQIKVLGQTGALTDTSNASPEASIAEIEALLDKVTGQLALARQEARDLNAKRATLAALELDAADNRKLLDETRAALEVIRLETGRELPGYSVIMAPPEVAEKPAEDSRKLLAVAGMALGAVLAFGGALLAGLLSPALRHSDRLGALAGRLPVKCVVRAPVLTAGQADQLRNAIKLRHLRSPRPAGGAQVIAVLRPETGSVAPNALALAESFARSGLKTLLVEADLTLAPTGATAGWREALLGKAVQPAAVQPRLWRLGAGADADLDSGAVGVLALRQALLALRDGHDVVVLSCGGLAADLSCQLLLAESDLALAELHPDDRRAGLLARLAQLDNLPRQGGGLFMVAARPDDPGFAA